MSISGAERSTETRISLPAPQRSGGMTLNEALARRRTLRELGGEPLTLAEIAQLLWAAQGVTSRFGARTAPSARALYPLELFVATPESLFRYIPDGHEAEVRFPSDLRPALAEAAHDQPAVTAAQAVFVLVGVLERCAECGPRADLYVKLEAGHAAQSLLLEAVGLGLGSVPVGSFDAGAVASALALPAGWEALYLLAVGRPAAAG